MERCLWAHPPLEISHGAWHLLVLMAKRSHDDEPYYYGGISHLMLNMPGLSVEAKRRAVMRHLKELQDAGLVKPTDRREGHRSVYELHLPGI